MTIGDIQTLEVQIPREIIQYWGWFLAFGIGVLALGIAAVVRAVTATVASMLFFGWLLGVGVRDRDRPSRDGGALGRFLSTLAGGDPVRNYRSFDRHEAGDQRRGRDGLYGDVFLDWRAVSTHRLRGDCVAGVGLAGGRWSHHICAGPASARAMAGLGTLGDRSVCRDRSDFLRLRLDRAGARFACDVKDTNKYPRLCSRCDKRVGECHG